MSEATYAWSLQLGFGNDLITGGVNYTTDLYEFDNIIDVNVKDLLIPISDGEIETVYGLYPWDAELYAFERRHGCHDFQPNSIARAQLRWRLA